MYADVVELFRRHKIEPWVTDESPRIEFILAVVAAGLGIAFLPTSFVDLGRRLSTEHPLLRYWWPNRERPPNPGEFSAPLGRAGADAAVDGRSRSARAVTGGSAATGRPT